MMSSKIIKSADLRTRARDLSRTNLLFIFGIIKAASIGVAVAVFLQIFIDLGESWSWLSILNHLPTFFLWAISYMCLIVTFDGAMFATIFLAHIPKKSETFFTFLLVGTESLQFAILSPVLQNQIPYPTVMSVEIQDWWYAILGFYLIFMYCIVYFGKIEIIKIKSDFEQDVYPTVDKYLKSFSVGLKLIFLSFVYTMIIFVTVIILSDPTQEFWFKLISSVMYIVIIVYAFILQHNQRRDFEHMIRELPE